MRIRDKKKRQGGNGLWQVRLLQSDGSAELAAKEPCVIVGRCADSILKETGNSLNIYIHAEKSI